MTVGTAASAQNLVERLQGLNYMVGEWKAITYNPTADGGWDDGHPGTSKITTILDGTFIQEEAFFNMGGGIKLTMVNTLGIDPRTKEFRMMALDKEFGTMDVYKGTMKGDSFSVTNLKSDARFETQTGALAFRLSVAKSDEGVFSLLVEATNDDGKSWKAYSKIIYKK